MYRFVLQAQQVNQFEKEQEAKLRAKYPGLRGANPLLQKRLSKGVSKLALPYFEVLLY